MSRAGRHDERELGTDYAPAAAKHIAAQAEVGQLIYAPPAPSVPARRKRRPRGEARPAVDHRPPDLTPLRNALAARRLVIEDQGAFFWRVARRAPSSRPTAGHPWRR